MKHRRIIIISAAVLLIAGIAVMLTTRSCGGGEAAASSDKRPLDTIPFMLTQMQRGSRLNTAEVKIHKIITHDDIMKLSGTILGKQVSLNIPAGKRKVAIPLYATIKAGIDLTKLTKSDIVRHGEKIEVFLPEPDIAITETHIDHEGIRQYVALTRRRFSDRELQEYEKQGRAAIERDIPAMNIKAMARESAARQLIPIIQAMGFKENNITITFADTDNGRSNTILRENK